MVPQWIIEKKRDGGKLSESEIRDFIKGYTDGTIPDYQMSALAMAIYFREMETEETAILTDAMMRSGEMLSWEGCAVPTADKHSTGGIGDKISIPLAPLVATLGVGVPMISGRGLGITGGTLDKLESIPNYNTRLDVEEFQYIVSSIGCSIIGQTATLAPADKKLYALRDVTGTVPSIPLITASIMSKKLAEGAESLVFDVKYGRAAFMRSEEDAKKLLASLVLTGKRLGRKCSAVLTPMNSPHGRAVGNTLEIIESVEILKGKGPRDVRDLTLRLAREMVALSKPELPEDEIEARLIQSLDSGRALERFKEMVEAHGGNAQFIDDYTVLPHAPVIAEVRSPKSGRVVDVNAEIIGKIVLELGGGRKSVTDAIDFGVGADYLVQIGDEIEKGAPLMRIHAATISKAEEMISKAEQAVTIE